MSLPLPVSPSYDSESKLHGACKVYIQETKHSGYFCAEKTPQGKENIRDVGSVLILVCNYYGWEKLMNYDKAPLRDRYAPSGSRKRLPSHHLELRRVERNLFRIKSARVFKTRHRCSLSEGPLRGVICVDSTLSIFHNLRVKDRDFIFANIAASDKHS